MYTPQLAVRTLKLAQLNIEHFMSPHLALLDENLSGSTLDQIGPTMMKRLHDANWEVRDSALELLTSVASISVCSK